MLKAHRKDVTSLIKGKKGGPRLSFVCKPLLSPSFRQSERQGEGDQGEASTEVEEESREWGC